MQKYIFVSIFAVCLFVLSLCVQNLYAQKPSDTYRKSLSDVLNDVRSRYNVELKIEEKNLKDKFVEFADWRFRTSLDDTLNLVLGPLDLVFHKLEPAADGRERYEISAFCYWLVSPEEGKSRLVALRKKFDTLEKWEARKTSIRNHIIDTLGIRNAFGLPTPNATLSPIRNFDGYSVQNVALETIPGVYVSGSIYRPLDMPGPFPVMLCPHGHFRDNNNSSNEDMRGRYRPDQQIRCAFLAKMGVIVFSYDMFGWGESQLQVKHTDHRDGIALVMQTLNAIRILDYVLSLPDIDASRVGITGASGGGSQSFNLAAIDERITACIPVVMVSSYHSGGCACESGLPIQLVPGMPTCNAEIAAMCAPRSLLIISDGNDWTKDNPNLEFPYLESIYAFYGKPENVENRHFDKEHHDYGISKRGEMYKFVAKIFGLDLPNKAEYIDETGITIENAKDLAVFPDGKLPDGAVIGIEKVRIALEESLKHSR